MLACVFECARACVGARACESSDDVVLSSSLFGSSTSQRQPFLDHLCHKSERIPLFVRPSITRSFALDLNLSLHQSIHSFFDPFIHQSIHPPTHRVIPPIHPSIHEGARCSSGINAANGACGPRFASRILPTVQRPWTSRSPLIVCSLDKSLSSCWRLIRLL